MGKKLYVGNLAYTTSEGDLQDMFAAHGTVIEVKVPFDRESGRPVALPRGVRERE